MDYTFSKFQLENICEKIQSEKSEIGAKNVIIGENPLLLFKMGIK